MKPSLIIASLISIMASPAAYSTSQLYLACQNGQEGSWAGGLEMTFDTQSQTWSAEIKLDPYSYFFISESSIASTDDPQFWESLKSQCYGPEVNDLDLSGSLGQPTTATYANGNCFALKRPGTYTITIAIGADNTAEVTAERAESTRLAGYSSTTYFDGIAIEPENPQQPTLPCYFIPKPARGTSPTDKMLTINHSHHSSSITYHWVKFSDRFAGYTQEWQYYYSDDHIPAADAETIALINSAEKFADLTASQIESRSHAVNMSSGPKHDCRNFSPAHYRVYGQHPSHPDSSSAKRTLGAVASTDRTAYEARVAYTLAIGDNTSAVDPIAVDPDSAATTADTPTPEYYNLQGMRISAPIPGQVCIVRQGEKVTKEIVR